jgi:hypothetical protein
MAALECKVAMVISRLVKLELLLELKFEQKKGTSLVKPVLSRVATERLSVPVLYFDIRAGISRTLPDEEGCIYSKCPSDGWRLDPRAVPSYQSGLHHCSTSEVTVLVIQFQIF